MAVAEMEIGTAGGADEAGRDEGVTVEVISSILVEKSDLLARYQLIQEPLRALKRARMTVHEVWERLTAFSRSSGCVGMTSRRRGVVEIEEYEVGTTTGAPR